MLCIDQFIDDELAEKIREEFSLDESSYYLTFRMKILSRNDLIDTDLDNNLKLLFFNYMENIVYIGLGTVKKGHFTFSFESYELTLGIRYRQKKTIQDNMEGFIFSGKYEKTQ